LSHTYVLIKANDYVFYKFEQFIFFVLLFLFCFCSAFYFYYSNSQELWAGDANPVYGATMSCNRFRHLLSHLRLDNRAERDRARLHDKFAAAREIFELFNQVSFFSTK
jgi:hypothetical protein